MSSVRGPGYAVSKENILVNGLSRQNEQRTVIKGSVVRVEGQLEAGDVCVRFLDKTSNHFEDASYCCQGSKLAYVPDAVWPLLLGIPSPMIRAELASNSQLCDQIASMRVGTSVEVLHNKIFYQGVIRYIGPVQAMGVGSVFGLELLVRSQSQLTTYDGSYAGTRYFNALPGTGLFVTLDKLKPILNYLSTINKKYESNYPVHDSQVSNADVDLIELMGGNWPGVTIEPTKKNTNGESKGGSGGSRNKSLNIVSHLISNRKSPKPRSETFVSHVNSVTFKDEVTSDKSNNDLTIGTLVEVLTDVSEEPLYGVVRWLDSGTAGIELEEDNTHLPLDLTDGMYSGRRRFDCAPGRALFVPVDQCKPDARFAEPQKDETKENLIDVGPSTSNIPDSKLAFGQMDSPVVPGAIPPLSMPTEEDVLAVCGKFRGIQGHHNSCYLDATLFAMFTYTSVFDAVLFRPRRSDDIERYDDVQRVLREEIVNPLRQNLYVRADRVMKLRKLLDELSSVTGLTSEEKDPEEFLNSLLAQILRAEPFLKLSSGQEAYHYQLFVEKDEKVALPSVQQLFEQSLASSGVRLKEVPSCLIVQMPRHGKAYKVYQRVLPSQLLDVTDVIEGTPRQCTVCGRCATHECRDCLGQCGVGLESTAFCLRCLEAAHRHSVRSRHKPIPLDIPSDYLDMAEQCSQPPPRLYMELFAVVCIETSHYVAFVKCGSGHEAPWCFFDSMADRKGEQNGYNIPEMVACPDMSGWLSDDGALTRALHDATPTDKQLPEHARRLLCDAYICMYQSPDVMMYR